MLGGGNLTSSQALMAYDDMRPLLIRGSKLLVQLHCLLSSLVDMFTDQYFPTSETLHSQIRL